MNHGSSFILPPFCFVRSPVARDTIMYRLVVAAGLILASLVSAQVPGSLKLVDGKFGKALDARATPVVVDGNPRFRNPPLTIECWAKLASKTGFNVLVASDTKLSGEHWEIYSYAGSGAFSAYLPGMNPSEIVSKTDICDGKWRYLAMTFDGKDVRLFVDGKKAQEQTVRPKKGAMPQPGPLTIGMALAGGIREHVGCDGLIDDVRLSSTIRKIDGVPSGPLPLDIPTIGLWRFDHIEAEDVDPAWTPRPAEGDAPPWEKATDKDWIDGRFQKMDTGPFLNATFSYQAPGGKQTVFKGTAIKVGEKSEGAVLYDRNQMRFAAGWTGGWLTHSSRRFGLLNTPTPATELRNVTAAGPGWADRDGHCASKHPATAPLPSDWLKYRGLYTHGNHIVLDYHVGGVAVLESPWAETVGGTTALTRSFEVAASLKPQRVVLAHLPGGERVRLGGKDSAILLATHGERLTGIALVGRAGLELATDGRVEGVLAPHAHSLRFKVLLWQGAKAERDAFLTLVGKSPPPSDLRGLAPGPALWKPLTTRGEVGRNTGPFAVDTLTIPYDNPYKALFFVTGVDVMPSGDLAVCTAHGDVWIVSGVDDRLDKLTWKRFATGLYQPMGLKVVDGMIVVLERGQLTRLHDLNNDGEADFYECINGDWHCAGGEHSFDTCLEVGPDGSYWFFKTGDTETPTGGCLLRVSKDGKKMEVFATGFRHPIGLGMSPAGVISGADQEGNWMPATRIDLYKKGGFYGDMRAHHRAVPPKIYDEPLCWLPRQMDNSAGGQVWVPEGKWGPLGGQMLHLSFGKCRVMLVLPQKVGEVMQAGAVDLGLQFLAGVKTGCFHPRDGHLYVVGLQGWQTAAVKDGCLQRVRWTGKKLLVPVGLAVHENGIKLTFSEPLDRKKAEEVKRYFVEQWNYHWSADYGSQRWSVANPDRVGQDRVPVKAARLLEDGKSIFLTLDGIRPVMQMQVRYNLATTAGDPVEGVVLNTIHKPEKALHR